MFVVYRRMCSTSGAPSQGQGSLWGPRLTEDHPLHVYERWRLFTRPCQLTSDLLKLFKKNKKQSKKKKTNNNSPLTKVGVFFFPNMKYEFRIFYCGELKAPFNWNVDSVRPSPHPPLFPFPQTGASGAHPEDELERLTKKMLFDMDHPPSEEYFGEWTSPGCDSNHFQSPVFRASRIVDVTC